VLPWSLNRRIWLRGLRYIYMYIVQRYQNGSLTRPPQPWLHQDSAAVKKRVEEESVVVTVFAVLSRFRGDGDDGCGCVCVSWALQCDSCPLHCNCNPFPFFLFSPLTVWGADVSERYRCPMIYLMDMMLCTILL
jgi:hypothetical protein